MLDLVFLANRRPTQSAYNRLEASAERRIRSACDRLVDGRDDVEEWLDRMATVLGEKHAAAAALGRQRAGDLSPRNADDDLLGQAVADEELRYLTRFADDIRGGRYTGTDGTLDGDKIGNRAATYSRKLLATANEAFVQSSPADATFDWHLGYVEKSCMECPALAEGGPYTPATIPTYPRAGATRCMFHCECSLVRNDGITGFIAPDAEDG
jgi:hypothetical protein